ncbi:MAG: hypothetical protein HY273_10235 [Gammaproteobacteria bacterium]|nr:hypothetical protein [Gammaproteobacteria bacterium]
MLTTRHFILAFAFVFSVFAAGCSDSGGNARQTETPTEMPTEIGTPTYTVNATAQTGGSISPASISVAQGTSATLTVTAESGFRIASVTPSGCTGTLSGTNYVTDPITADCSVTASFVALTNFFTVSASAAAGGSILPLSVSVEQGASATLTVTPESGFRIASITPNGCTGTLTGTSYVTGSITADCSVAASFVAITNFFTVNTSAGVGGSISPTSISVAQGTSATLTVIPESGFGIASVTPSGCTGTLSGTNYLTAPLSSDCTVAVTFAANTFTVSAIAGAGGSISPLSTSVASGAKAVLSITPDTGFYIASVTAAGCSGSLAGMTYTTGPIMANCTVTTAFSTQAGTNTYTVNALAGAGGSITPGTASVIQDATATLTVTPDSGFRIASVTASGCTGTLTGNTYVTGPITANCTVTASFVANLFTVTASAGAGGSITPASVSVAQGVSTLLAVTADTGFSVASITAVGCSGTLAGDVYTTGAITADCNVTVTFAEPAITRIASKIATGVSHTCALSNAGPVVCWGDNYFCELGNGNTVRSMIPVTVAGLSSPVTALATGSQHTCALTRLGTVQCWGYNAYGQLGNGSTTSSNSPVTVTGISGQVTALVAGNYHNCVLTSAGAVQCWGYNANGQLGNGTNTNSSTPVTVAGLSASTTTLVAGTQHNCVLTSAGAMQCWGYNSYGQLGNGSTMNSTTPVAVTGLSGSVTTLAAGNQHTCALTSVGAIQCWGFNTNGQLGNGSNTSSTTPVTVTSLSGSVLTLTAGAQHTCALSNVGTAQCWGYNLYGQLGNGSTTSSNTPVTVTGLSGTVTMLTSGFGHLCALISTGAVQCWGYNLYGQLGNGSTTNSGAPMTVTGLSGP